MIMVADAYPSFNWLNPTRVIFGVGKLNELPAVLDSVCDAGARVFLVTGRSSLRRRGILDTVLETIGRDRVELFDRVPPFPSPAVVDEAAQICREFRGEVVLGIGGGSVLDTAKCVAMMMRNEGSASEFGTREKEIGNRGLPFVAVPTTSGSSSEVTSGAALWDLDAKRHMGVGSPLMFPDVAIVDPELAMSMPASLAAASGMDAFTSAFESYWSLESEPLSDAICLDVIGIFARNLARSCIQGDLESRTNCALAATMSGIAYSNSHPNACHAVGSPLTIYWGVEHGQAVGIALPWLLRWNADAIAHKVPALCHALGVANIDDGLDLLKKIIRRCGIKEHLSDLGLQTSDRPVFVNEIRWDRMSVLPRSLSQDDAGRMFDELL